VFVMIHLFVQMGKSRQWGERTIPESQGETVTKLRLGQIKGPGQHGAGDLGATFLPDPLDSSGPLITPGPRERL
jgi:hypothetical protein